MSAKIYSLAHATEDIDKVLEAILNVCPKTCTPRIRTTKAKGHYGNQIVPILLVVVGASKATNLLGHLWKNLRAVDRVSLYRDLVGHIDQSGVLHVRIDKQSALQGTILLKDEDPVKVELLFKRGNQEQPMVEQVENLLNNLPQ